VSRMTMSQLIRGKAVYVAPTMHEGNNQRDCNNSIATTSS